VGFGGGGRSAPAAASSQALRRGSRRGEDYFEQAVFGNEVDPQVELTDICRTLQGHHGRARTRTGATCDQCKGAGQVTSVTCTIWQHPAGQYSPKCHGSGKILKSFQLSSPRRQALNPKAGHPAQILAGIDGATIRLRVHGEAIANGPKGNLFPTSASNRAQRNSTREGDLILSEEAHQYDRGLPPK